MAAVYFCGPRRQAAGRDPASSVSWTPAHVLRRRSRRGRAWRRPPGPGPRRRSPGGGPGRSWAGSRGPSRSRPTCSRSRRLVVGVRPAGRGEVARGSPELLEVGAALRRAGRDRASRSGCLDVGGDAEAEDEHQQRRADEGEGQPDRIAQDLHRSRCARRRASGAAAQRTASRAAGSASPRAGRRSPPAPLRRLRAAPSGLRGAGGLAASRDRRPPCSR